MSKSFLLFVLAVAISSTFVVVESRLNIQLETVFEREQESDFHKTDSDASEADATQFGATTRIVGGTEADPGQYPYFVEMGGCGGALIAPDIVLFAAHCGVQFEGKNILIGSYNKGTADAGAQGAFCEEYKQDPNYGTGGSSINYDFALCKLNSPVTIDQDTVILELNFEDNVPARRDDLIVMGQGRLEDGGDTATTLNHVTVPYLTNDQCNQPNRYNGKVTDNMLCAGYPDLGGKDSCQGDSGGPIIQSIMRNGKIVHKHVGVVSWGYGCAEKNHPGVYSRTSKRTDWILTTMCNDLNSISDACEVRNIPECDGKELSIKIKNDNYPTETAWTLEDSNGTIIKSRNNYRYKHVENVADTVCMPYNTCYDWTITDSYGDGMCYANRCGSYLLEIDGGSVDPNTANPNFGSSIGHEICSGPAPTDILTATPTAVPSASPSGTPSAAPSASPSGTPSAALPSSASPSRTLSAAPSASPSGTLSAAPSASPSGTPSAAPSASPSRTPSAAPSASPSRTPSAAPSVSPSGTPSEAPTAPCGGNANLKYYIEIQTDKWQPETNFSTYPLDGDSRMDESSPVFIGKKFDPNTHYNRVFSNSLDSDPNGFVCLQDNQCYVFVIIDDYGDGLAPPSTDNGYYKGNLGGKEIFNGSDFGFREEKEFCTGNARLATGNPTATPTSPTTSPTAAPSASPTAAPTDSPSGTPTAAPSFSPTAAPTASPTAAPTDSPSGTPTATPTTSPSVSPTVTPTASPTAAPTASPTAAPTDSPSGTPTATPTTSPTAAPTDSPSGTPTATPTTSPSVSPTVTPTASPTAAPTASPTAAPTDSPSGTPTATPTTSPSVSPTVTPTASPTAAPTATPTATPACLDDPAFFWKGKKRLNCKRYLRNTKKLVKKCGKTSGQKLVSAWCPMTCGKGGVGECANSQARSEQLKVDDNKKTRKEKKRLRRKKKRKEEEARAGLV